MNIPEDVERYMLEWVRLSSEMEIVERVCKRWKTYMRMSSFYLQKSQAMERLLMILEDQDHETQKLRESLGSCWEPIYKWSWPLASDSQLDVVDWQIGDTVDARDRINVWGPARIIGRRISPSPPILADSPMVEEFEVRFHGWSIGFNEWISPDKIAKVGSKSINPRNLFQSLPEENNSWALCRHGDVWEMESLTVQDISGNTRILSIGSRNLSVTADNIGDYIRASSNTATYLLLSGQRFRPDGRNLAL